MASLRHPSIVMYLGVCLVSSCRSPCRLRTAATCAVLYALRPTVWCKAGCILCFANAPSNFLAPLPASVAKRLNTPPALPPPAHPVTRPHHPAPTALSPPQDPPAVVTEYCARGSLNDVLKRARASTSLAAQLDWPRRLNMALDAAKGMLYLHSCTPPIIHRDVSRAAPSACGLACLCAAGCAYLNGGVLQARQPLGRAALAWLAGNAWGEG